MTEQCRLGRIEVAEYSDDEGSIEDDRSNVEGSERRFNQKVMFKNMLQVATNMSPKDRQEQMVLLSLAMSAITKANADSRADAKMKIIIQEAVQFKGSLKKQNKRNGYGSLSSTTLPTKKKWSLEDQKLVKELRAMNLSWEDLSRYHFPGRTRVQLQGLYNHWLGKGEESAETEKHGDVVPTEGEDFEKSTNHDEDGLSPCINEEMPQAPPTMSAFERQRRANVAENKAILDRIAQPMECHQQLTKEKRRRPAASSSPPNPTRRSERKIIARRRV